MSDLTILTNSNKAQRSIELPMPEILQAETLQSIVDILGEDLAKAKLLNQLTIDFRSHIRGKLESVTDGVPTYTDEQITQGDYSDWKPEARVRRSAEEKAADVMGKLSIDQIKAAMAKAGIDPTAFGM